MKKLRTRFNKSARRRRKSKSAPNAAPGLRSSAEKEREFRREAATLLARNSDPAPGAGTDPGKPELN